MSKCKTLITVINFEDPFLNLIYQQAYYYIFLADSFALKDLAKVHANLILLNLIDILVSMKIQEKRFQMSICCANDQQQYHVVLILLGLVGLKWDYG